MHVTLTAREHQRCPPADVNLGEPGQLVRSPADLVLLVDVCGVADENVQRPRVATYVFSDFCSSFWLMFGKL